MRNRHYSALLLCWVAVKGRNLRCYIGEAIVIAIYTQLVGRFDCDLPAAAAFPGPRHRGAERRFTGLLLKSSS